MNSSQNTVSSNTLVSVVMVTYNGAAYLNSQLNSVVNQTHTNIEIIIVDNASTDETFSILQTYQQKDNRITLYRNNKNTGPNTGFEYAFKQANGLLIAPCDQDDIWELDKIEQMLAAWGPDTQFMFTHPGQFKDGNFNERKPISNYFFRDVSDLRMLVFHTPVSGHATMFCSSLLNDCPAFDATIYHDWWLSMHTALKHKLVYCNATLTWQRVHANNSSLQVYRLNKKEKEAALRGERISMLENFLPAAPSHLESVQSLKKYLAALKKINGKQFCRPMFFYVLKNRKWVFHYKRKPFAFVSHIKHAFKMAKTGV